MKGPDKYSQLNFRHVILLKEIHVQVEMVWGFNGMMKGNNMHGMSSVSCLWSFHALKEVVNELKITSIYRSVN